MRLVFKFSIWQLASCPDEVLKVVRVAVPVVPREIQLIILPAVNFAHMKALLWPRVLFEACGGRFCEKWKKGYHMTKRGSTVTNHQRSTEAEL